MKQEYKNNYTTEQKLEYWKSKVEFGLQRIKALEAKLSDPKRNADTMDSAMERIEALARELELLKGEKVS